MDKTAIYQFSSEYAMQHGEMDACKASREANTACARAIDEAIKDSQIDPYHYDLKAAAKSVIEQFGYERVNWVLAGCIKQSFNDGRYSRANKDWADRFPIPNDKYSGFYTNTHPTVLDGFVDKVRTSHIHMMAQAVGKYEKSRRTAERNRLTAFDDDSGAFVPKVSQGQLWVRYDEIVEKQAARRASAVERLAAAKESVKPPAPANQRAKERTEL